MAMTCCELKWLRYLLKDIQVPISGPTPLNFDNHDALYIASNPVYHEWTKHIEIYCHFVREELQANQIDPTYLPTDVQLANIFTKTLSYSQFLDLFGHIGLL